jgi:hypothetical protein
LHDRTRFWLLRPGFTLARFGQLPSWLDETDERPATEQLGERWQPLDGQWRFHRYGQACNSKIWNGSQGFELLGSIHLRRELLMLFEGSVVAIVKSIPAYSRPALEVGRVDIAGAAMGNEEARS